MPIYEYECADCGHQLEKLQRMSDDALTDCPECKSEGLRRLVSAAGFRLSGSGWYETDFKAKKDQRQISSSDNKAASSDSSSKKPAAKTSSDSSSKPAK